VPLDSIKFVPAVDSRVPDTQIAGIGVETTTTTSQGVATSVGMASARNGWQHAKTARLRNLFDFNVYAMCGEDA